MNTVDIFKTISTLAPAAYANIRGLVVVGTFVVFPYQSGSIVIIEATGLPNTDCDQGIHAVHIHEGSTCIGVNGDPFGGVGSHYSTESCPHPYHTGDLPPLFSTNGNAWMALYTDKFTPTQIIGKTIVIHSNPDNFTSQPSGQSGSIIACGEITKYR